MIKSRKRPHLVITYRYTLIPGQKSEAKNFTQTANWFPGEKVLIVDQVTNKMAIEAHLIIDLLNNRIIKNREPGLDDQSLLNTVMSRHRDVIKAAITRWAAESPENLNQIQTLANKDAEDA